MRCRPQLKAPPLGAIAELAPRAVIAGDGFPQIIWPVWVFGLVRLMSLIHRASQVVIQQSRGDRAAEDCLYRRHSHIELATVALSRPDDRPCGDFRVVDRADRLRVVRDALLEPLELRRVHPGRLADGEPQAAGEVKEFATGRFRKAAGRVLGAAVRGLERDRTIWQ